LDVFTTEDMQRVPRSPGKGKTCPSPKYAARKVLGVDDCVTLSLVKKATNETTKEVTREVTIVEVPIDQIGGIRIVKVAEEEAKIEKKAAEVAA
jgi:hypothetical protein